MSPAGSRPDRSTGRARTTPTSGRYATGQLLAVGIVLLIALPLLPLILLIIAWIRLRDRAAARAARRDTEAVHTPPRSALHATP
ncbi:hypothetical protein GCM10022225_01290 [Plantactinospora mayteni]|uniref:DUF4229 domain-containing protein n=1 Tax=Plantactinospora mayteni TaxID=566021 RepID=A0ABQ4EY96_9ACTN|nr:hypothetical protein [Plantactinospora mayteni]GIG99643.1 hypothetical protein Pma05_62160 [Plantactinospora mayteni]